MALKEIIVGIIVGVASMLPGISGATMCVVFGIYERIVRDIAKLRVWLVKDIWFIIFMIVGVAVGTILSAKLLHGFMDDYPAECLMLFVGLVAGQIPTVLAAADLKENRSATPAQWGALVVGVVVMAFMIGVDMIGMTDGDVTLSKDLGGFLLMFVVGIVVAVSALLPGLSHSTVLIVFGLFSAFTAAVGDLDVFFIAAIGLGAVFGALVFSKILHKALEEHHRTMMFLILGLTLGSLVSILYTASGHFDSAIHIVASIVTLVIGFGIAMLFMRMGTIEETATE